MQRGKKSFFRHNIKVSFPAITYPSQLPITARVEEIKELIRANQVIILAGETGSGKTTQLPKICLELGRGQKKLIGHTQPRRIAARTVAERISAELNTKLGDLVGYQVRFTDVLSPQTRVKLMTDGILLAEIQNDPQLEKYDTLIIDEAHERSLNIDFILGYLANLLPQRPDLKIIITSATIETTKFATHFGRAQKSIKPLDKTIDYAELADSPLAPVIEVSGRTYPVEIRYRPLINGETNQKTPDNYSNDPKNQCSISESYYPEDEPIDLVTGIIAACRELMQERPPATQATNTGNDILVFLSGEGEIRSVQAALEEEFNGYKNRIKSDDPRNSTKTKENTVDIVPLFARLSAAEQHRIFEPHHRRRIVLATNIAETSLTVPGIRYVVDAGTARISRYSPRTKVQRLPIEPISQASANQRAGRCGRLANGIAIRLYSEADFLTRPEFTEPEILRTSLASVILQMKAAGLGSITNFPFLEAPDPKAIRDGVLLLEELGALKDDRLTPIGRLLAKLPIDPRLGRMLLEAEKFSCASEILVIVAALSVQDVRERPLEKQTQADAAHLRFVDPESDFLAYLNIWRYLRTLQRDYSSSALRRRMRNEFLNFLRFKEWEDVVAQLRQLAKPLHLNLHKLSLPTPADLSTVQATISNNQNHANDANNFELTDAHLEAAAAVAVTRGPKTPSVEQIHRSILVGLLSNLGYWDQTRYEYEGCQQTFFNIWPGSGLYKKRHTWVMAAELVETSRLYARTVGMVKPEWIEQAGRRLLKHSYSEPSWNARKGAALVLEKVMLRGLTLIADRPVLAAKTGDAGQELAREMFIRHALVDLDWPGINHFRFVKENQLRIEEAYEVERRRRQIGLVADEEARYQFFADRLPTNIYSGSHFSRWYKQNRQAAKLLVYPREFLLGSDLNSTDFPDYWQQDDLRLALHYEYQPGKAHDGLTLQVPLLALPRLKPIGFDWLVPGLRLELVAATIRALPKRVRRHLVPTWQTANEILEIVNPLAEQIPFRTAFSQAVLQLKQLEISEADWANTVIPAHLTMQFQILAQDGQTLARGDSLIELRNRLAKRTQQVVENTVRSAVQAALQKQNRKQNLPSPTKENLKSQAEVLKTLAAAPHLHPNPRRLLADSGLLSESDSIDTLPNKPLPASLSTELAGLKVTVYPAVVEEFSYTHNSFSIFEAKNNATVAAIHALQASLPSDYLPNISSQKTHILKENEKPNEQKNRLAKAVAANCSSNWRVALRLLTVPSEQAAAHASGVQRLVLERCQLATNRITTRWTGHQALVLAASPYHNTEELVADCQRAAVNSLLDNWISHKPFAQRTKSSNKIAAAEHLTSSSQINNSNTRLAKSSSTHSFSKLISTNRSPRTTASLDDLRLLRDSLVNSAKSPTSNLLEENSAGSLLEPTNSANPVQLGNDVDSTQLPLDNLAAIRSAADLEEAILWVKPRLEDEVYRLVGMVVASLENYQKAQEALLALNSAGYPWADLAIRRLNSLVYRGFVLHTPVAHLAHLPRYCQAEWYRASKAMGISGNNNRYTEVQNREAALDEEIFTLQAELLSALQNWQDQTFNASQLNSLLRARWLLEELRVSFFAQHLGTAGKVSTTRIRRLLA